MLKAIIACGSSGGHFFPGLALARELKKKDAEVLFVISSRRKAALEGLIKREGFSFKMISAGPMPHGVNLGYILFFIRSFISFFTSLKILHDFKPNFVVGFGSYASAPIVLAGWFLKVKTLIHEQNVTLGRANRFCASFVTKIAVSFTQTIKTLSPHSKKKAIFTGNPIRDEILNTDKHDAITRLGLKENKFTVLVMGGSLGAHSINQAVMQFFSSSKNNDNLQFVHLTGKSDFDSVSSEYKKYNTSGRILPYLDRIGEAYAASDLVIARSGATTIAELTSLGLASILVPYPHGDKHQSKNASLLSENGAALLLEDRLISGDAIRGILSDIMEDRERLEGFRGSSRALGRPKAAEDLANEVLKL